MKWPTGILAALVLMSCGPGSGSVPAHSASTTRTIPAATFGPSPTNASAARTLCPAERAAPAFAPSAPSSRNLVLAWMGNDMTKVVIRDITDLRHPATVGVLPPSGLLRPAFVSATDISYADQAGLERAPLSGGPVTTVTTCGGAPFAWSPDGTAAAYVGPTGDPMVQQFHVIRDGRDVVDGTVPGTAGGFGCESRQCGDSWDTQLLYSPDGAYISLVIQLGPLTAFRIWSARGDLLKAMDSGASTMSVWSGDTLYWRDEQGIRTWRAGSEGLLLPGVSWVRPHASPDGRTIVYETRDAGYTTAHVWLLDTATGKARLLKSSRSEPAFLNSHLIWYAGEVSCTPAGSCITPTTDSGKYYIYDLNDRTETQSVIARVWDVWPHPPDPAPGNK